jgi:predicted alpha/beta superfamily hydrolase
MRHHFPLSSLLLCLLTVGGCFQDNLSSVPGTTAVDVEIGKSYSFESEKIAGSWKVQVSLPPGYEQSEDTYPVVYALHGGYYFKFAVGGLQRLMEFGDIPEVIIVGISNESNGYFAFGTEKADQFLDFMESDIFPFIEHNFKTHEDRIVMGWHYTAGFAFHTLVNRPHLFTYYIPASPYLQGFDISRIDFATLSKFAATNPDSKRHLYFGAFSNERSVTEAALSLDSLLKRTDIESLNWEFNLIDPDYSEGIEISVYRLWQAGLKTVYAPYRAQVLDYQSLEDFKTNGGLDAMNKHYAERSLQFGGTSRPFGLLSLLSMAENADDYQLFDKLMNAYGSNYEGVNFNRVLRFAAYYLKHERPDKAIAIYHSVIGFYPNSVSVYEALGQAYLAADQSRNATSSYIRAIELAEAHSDGRLNSLKGILADLQDGQ